MATIITSFDTKTKTLVVEIDGKAVENVDYVSISRSYHDRGAEPEFYCSVETASSDDGSGIRTYTRLCASDKNPEFQPEEETERGKALASLPNDVTRDIAKFFGA